MNKLRCLYCQQDDDQVPLVQLSYRGKQVSICPQHLPILIHKPEELADIFARFDLELDAESTG